MENNINNNPNDGDMFQYIDIDDALFTFNNDEQSPLNPQNQINQVSNSEQKITTKASFACFRVLVLYFVYIIENRPLTPFLQGIITFLLVHEVLALSNFIGMKTKMKFFGSMSIKQASILSIKCISEEKSQRKNHVF